jgi:lysozyme
LIQSGEKFPDCLTEQQCVDLLKKDLTKFESCVQKYVTRNINDNQFAALVSWTFNLGCGSLQSSTMLKRINDGSSNSVVCSEMKRWNKAGGKVLPGLVRRRQAECDLYSR